MNKVLEELEELNFNEPIDSIIEYKDLIILGSYNYNDNIKTKMESNEGISAISRSGHLYFLEKFSLKIIKKVKTSGTFTLYDYKNIIYSANASDISSFDEEGNLLNIYETRNLNTYLFVKNETVYTIDITGSLNVYDLDLNLLYKIQITNEPCWVCKVFDDKNLVLIGAENGDLYKFNIKTKKTMKIFKANMGIIDFIKIKDVFYISSYDDSVIVMDNDLKNVIKRIENVGSLWKMINYKDSIIFGASMYEGFKIFDTDFNLLMNIKTKSICYGLSIISPEMSKVSKKLTFSIQNEDIKILFSSFYENKVFILNKINLKELKSDLK